MVVEKNTILYEEKENISYLQINMPPANKMIPEFLQEIVEVLRHYTLKTTTKGVIVYGKNRHFSSGADVEKLLKFIHEGIVWQNDEIVQYPEWYIQCKKAFMDLYELKIPVISAIRGFCIGSGFELALASHIRICEQGARLGLPEATFGILPGVNGTLRMTEEIGVRRALEFVLRGDLFSPEELPEGLITCIVGKKQALTCAENFIKYVADNQITYEREKASEVFLQYMDEMKEKEKENV